MRIYVGDLLVAPFWRAAKLINWRHIRAHHEHVHYSCPETGLSRKFLPPPPEHGWAGMMLLLLRFGPHLDRCCTIYSRKSHKRKTSAQSASHRARDNHLYLVITTSERELNNECVTHHTTTTLARDIFGAIWGGPKQASAAAAAAACFASSVR